MAAEQTRTTKDALDPNLTSVIVPARNEEDFIGRCLDAILSQTEPRIEVLVVDGASTDRTAEVVMDYSARDDRVKLLSNPDAITPKSLNVALWAARGKWLVRVDAHSTVPADYVEKALTHLRTEKWGAVGGRKDGVGVTAEGRAIAAAMASRFGVGNSTYHYGTEVQTVEHVPFGAYPTALLRELGGWDEKLITNQDFEMDYRLRLAGHELLFDPSMRIDWHSRQAVGDLFRQYRRYGRGKADVAFKHPESLRARHLVAPALVGSWAVALLSGRKNLMAAAVLPYAAALASASTSTGRTLDEEARRYVPAAFAAMHVAWGIGFWEGVWRNLKKRRLEQQADASGATPV